MPFKMEYLKERENEYNQHEFEEEMSMLTQL
jgi:hypothetical protein